MPQGSILRTLLSIIYENDLCDVFKKYKLITFANDTNLFFLHRNKEGLFHTASLELNKVFKWCNVNRLSLNKGKTKCTLFQKAHEKYNIPLKLPSL